MGPMNRRQTFTAMLGGLLCPTFLRAKPPGFDGPPDLTILASMAPYNEALAALPKRASDLPPPVALPRFEVGEPITAEALNAMSAAIRGILEARGRPAIHVAYSPPSDEDES